MARLDDLQRVEKAIVRIARIGGGRDAARNRAERSGVFLSRPAISLISALHASGPVRLSRLSDLTDLEAPLVSREIARLCADGYVKRAADPTDGRATIVDPHRQGPAGLHWRTARPPTTSWSRRSPAGGPASCAPWPTTSSVWSPTSAVGPQST